MSAAVEEAEVVESTAIERHPGSDLSLVPQTTARDLVARLDVIRDAMQNAMVKDIDYGVIPGTGSKPTLLKPGAEKLGVLFQLDVQIENLKTWHDDGHLTVVSHAIVYHAPSGLRVASGEGICSTRESKYAYRNIDRTCPACGAASIIKGKAEYGGGWLCWKNHKTTPGCGEKFAENDPAIVGQEVGKKPNPDIADTYNTVDKMASKRARIDAILAATGASALFTQDAEDLPGPPSAEAGGAGTPPATPEPTADLIEQVNAGIVRLVGEPGWTLADILQGATNSYKRPVESLDALSADELRQVLSAMPDELPFR